MTNVHFSLGFRRTDAAGQLCTLGTVLSVSKVTLSSDIMGWDTTRCLTVLYQNPGLFRGPQISSHVFHMAL